MSDDFLARWSRRKQAVRRADAAREPPAPSAGQEQPATEEAQGAAAAAEEVADLPALDTLTAESDIAAFLRRGVPDALRNAALRRVWALDPSVRDRVGDALDYAWDWHVAGDVPGSGPLLPTDDPQAMIARMFSDPANQSDERDRVIATETSAPGDGGCAPPGDVAATPPPVVEDAERMDVARTEGISARTPAREDVLLSPDPRPHPEVPERSAGLEGGLQGSRRELEGSFEAPLRVAPQDEGGAGSTLARSGPSSRDGDSSKDAPRPGVRRHGGAVPG